MSIRAIKDRALSRRNLMVTAVTAGLVLVAGAAAFASIPGSNGAIHGCYANSTGALRVVDASTCGGSETAITWQLGPTLSKAEITTQPTLLGSDGNTWTDIDNTNLKLTFTPVYSCQAIITGNADLWTDTAGLNQDIGISLSGGVYPTTAGQPQGWKESGGFAGTFSPNAAFVQTTQPLTAGTTYTTKLRWKTNHAASGSAKIYAGAGPISGKFSPTSLTVHCVHTL